MRGGVATNGSGVTSFYRGRRAMGRGSGQRQRSTGRRLTPLMGGGFIEGVRRGEIMVASKGMRQHLEAQNSGARGGRRRRERRWHGEATMLS
jgi:hypothetical protein